MRKKEICIFLLVVSFLLLSGCAVGNKHMYHGLNVNFAGEGSATVAVATHDQRPYIVSRNKAPNFVGLQRGGYGNPFNVTTASGNSLAEDITDTLARSLRAKGFNSIPVGVKSSDNDSTVKAALKDKKASRAVLATLYEWKSDTYNNTSLKYDVRMEVLDAQGTTIAEKRISGGDHLGGSAWNPPAHAKKVIPTAFIEKFETLLNDEQIAKALLKGD